MDGERLAREALTSGSALTLLVDERRSDVFQPLIRDAGNAGVEVVYLSPALLSRLSDAPSPQGVIAEASLPEQARPDSLGSRAVVLDGVQDPGNVGTIIRTLEAAGCTGVLTTETCADPYSMKAVRASMGSVLRVPVCVSRSASEVVGVWKTDG
ncbi:MAG: RNA methyltransferase, partial [Oscillospiraceae bacterium]|nr:RNA methyltransferase [Oscillospiraceae bacterium]